MHNHYLLVSDEPVLIDRAISDIKKKFNIDESFDFDRFSMPDYEFSEIINKLYTPPFVSSKRMLVLKNIEKESANKLREFASLVGRVPATVCLVMVYEIDKRKPQSRSQEGYDRVIEMFPSAHVMMLMLDATTFQRTIRERLERLGIGGQLDIAEYLKEEFFNDITGMESEFQKIENYLFQFKQLGLSEVKDISRGLVDYDAYRVARSFVQRRAEAIELFVALEPFIKTPLMVIDGIARMLRNNALKSSDRSISRFATELLQIDSRVKAGSDFSEILLEIFFIKNLLFSSKGAIYGKQSGKTKSN